MKRLPLDRLISLHLPTSSELAGALHLLRSSLGKKVIETNVSEAPYTPRAAVPLHCLLSSSGQALEVDGVIPIVTKEETEALQAGVGSQRSCVGLGHACARCSCSPPSLPRALGWHGG